MVAMRRAKTAIDPYHSTVRIVADGPFRLTRNPLYLTMAIIYLGVACAANAMFVLVLLPIALVMVDRGVIAREEEYLERKFGGEYLRYKARVRRWI